MNIVRTNKDSHFLALRGLRKRYLDECRLANTFVTNENPKRGIAGHHIEDVALDVILAQTLDTLILRSFVSKQPMD